MARVLTVSSRGWSGCRCGCRCTDIRGVFGDLGCSCRNLHSLEAGVWLPLARVVVWLWLRWCRFLPRPKVTHFCCTELLVPISWVVISLVQQQIFVLEHNSSTFRDLYLLTAASGPPPAHCPLTARAQEWSKKLMGSRGNLSLLLPVVFLHLLCKCRSEVRLEMECANPSCQHCCEHISFRASIPALSSCCSLVVSPLGGGTSTWCWAEQPVLGSQLAISN